MAQTEPANPHEIGYIAEAVDPRNPVSVFQRIAQNEFDYESANEELLDLRAQLQARLKVIENLTTERKALDKLAFYYLKDQLHECVIAYIWSPVEAKQIPYAVFVNPLSPSTTALRVVRSTDLPILTETEAREFEARGPLTTTPKESEEPANAEVIDPSGQKWIVSEDGLHAWQGDSEIDATLGYAAAKAKYNSNQLNVWAQMSCNRRDSVWSTNS